MVCVCVYIYIYIYIYTHWCMLLFYSPTVLYLKSYRRRGVQGVCARGVCKGCVQGVCKGCYLTPNRKKSWGGSGQHFFTFWFIASRGRHVVNRCLGLFIPVFRARRADWGPDSWLGQGSEIASRKKYLRFSTFLENVCRGSGGSPRGPVGHLSDENEALGPRNPFIRVPMPSFDKKILKKNYPSKAP